MQSLDLVTIKTTMKDFILSKNDIFRNVSVFVLSVTDMHKNTNSRITSTTKFKFACTTTMTLCMVFDDVENGHFAVKVPAYIKCT